MRLKPTDQSITYSEIHFDSPEPTDRNHQNHEIQPYIKEENTPKNQLRSQDKLEGQPKNKREYTGGRVGFKGTLKLMYQTKKDKYIKDGNQMLQVHKDIKMTQEKIIMVQSRINALTKRDEQAKKKIEQTVTHQEFMQNVTKVNEEKKQQKTEQREKQKIDLSCQLEKIKEVRMKKAESIEKIKRDKDIQRLKLFEKTVKEQQEIERMRKEKEQELRQSKEEKHKKIFDEKQQAEKKKEQREKLFLGRIQHCYHQEKKEKEKQKEENYNKIKELEEIEAKLMEQLKNTQRLEQEIKVRTFGNSSALNNSLSQKNYQGINSQRSPQGQKKTESVRSSTLTKTAELQDSQKKPLTAAPQQDSILSKGTAQNKSQTKLIPKRPFTSKLDKDASQRSPESSKVSHFNKDKEIMSKSAKAPSKVNNLSSLQQSPPNPIKANHNERLVQHHYKKAQDSVQNNNEKLMNKSSPKPQNNPPQPIQKPDIKISPEESKDFEKLSSARGAKTSARNNGINPYQLNEKLAENKMKNFKPVKGHSKVQPKKDQEMSKSKSSVQVSAKKNAMEQHNELNHDYFNETQPEVKLNNLDSQHSDDDSYPPRENMSMQIVDDKNPFNVSNIHQLHDAEDEDSNLDMDSFELEKANKKKLR